MPLVNITVDDASAIFEYYIPTGQPWTDSPTTDQELHNYWDSTYHSTNQFRAQASVRFQGTAVYLYAAKRSRHGIYEIYLDGTKVLDGDSHSDTAQYNQFMYSNSNLTPAWHNVTIINTDSSNSTYTEVDYIRWTPLMPDSLTESFGTTIPYSQDNMSYSSLNAWKANSEGSNPSMVTTTDGASVNITFTGNGVELWGKTGPNYGRFSAQVEGYDEHQLNANSQQAHDALLFRQDNLTSGTHTILVTNRGASSLAITSAKPILWTDPNDPSSNPSPTSTSTSTPSPGAQSGSHTTNSTVIAGAVVGVVVGLAALVLILFFIFRSRRRKQREDDIRVHPSHGPAYIDATPFQLPTSPNEQSPYIQSSASVGNAKYRNESSQYVANPMQYHPVSGSPGMSSRGSFDVPHSANLGVPSSSTGGSGSRPNSAGTPRSGGKYRPSAEPATREDDIPQGVEVIRDSDAGPILLPPAYSAAMEARAPVELHASNPATPVSSTPVSAKPTTSGLPPGAASPIIPNHNFGR